MCSSDLASNHIAFHIISCKKKNLCLGLGFFQFAAQIKTVSIRQVHIQYDLAILDVEVLESGEKLSNGFLYQAKRKRKIATVPLGYADAYSRELSKAKEVLIKGIRCPVIGKICIDKMMVDVTGLDIHRYDEVVLIGKQGKEEIPIEEVDNNGMDIPAFVICMLAKRLPRVYIKDNKIKKVLNLLTEP